MFPTWLGNRRRGRLKVDHLSTRLYSQVRQTPVVSEEKHLCVFRQFTDNLHEPQDRSFRGLSGSVNPACH
jgi:hypothetical protein